ncbi:unnamed protein product [Soboliphyme baturini]|uniref:Peptidase A1 domain-containing protein n=1 Tax=Soboliphyme baturini TaxID=241478 RepID=A0A183J7K7_9BILA|nr:unnamed protein product [Soboliphyme baturini]
MYYSPTKDVCQPTMANAVYGQKQCRDYRQAMWYRAQDIGCGLSLCDSIQGAPFPSKSFLAVCAMTYIATGSQKSTENAPAPPFVQGQIFKSCQYCCRSYKCSKNLCSPTAAQLIDLTRLENPVSLKDAFATTSAQISQYMGQGMTSTSVVGKICTVSSVSGCPYLGPVNDLYSSYFNTHYYVLDQNMYQIRLSQGWTPMGILGYAVPGPILCGATVPIYNVWDQLSGYIQLPKGPQLAGLLSPPRRTRYYGGIGFAVWSA